MTVGPWAHLTLDADVTTREGLAFLARHLPVADADAPPRSARVRTYVTGAQQWRDLPDWPPASEKIGARGWAISMEKRIDGPCTTG